MLQLTLFERGAVVRREADDHLDAMRALGHRKFCRTCGGDYPWAGFPRRGTDRRSICFMCQQTARDRKKWGDRFLPKVQWARRTHARRLHRPARELRLVFGWTDDRMAADARQVWHEGCPLCGRVLAFRPPWFDWPPERVTEAFPSLRYATFFVSGERAKDIYPWMGTSLCALILRIVDRSAPPWYGTNTRWCCTFCRGRST